MPVQYPAILGTGGSAEGSGKGHSQDLWDQGTCPLGHRAWPASSGPVPSLRLGMVLKSPYCCWSCQCQWSCWNQVMKKCPLHTQHHHSHCWTGHIMGIHPQGYVHCTHQGCQSVPTSTWRQWVPLILLPYTLPKSTDYNQRRSRETSLWYPTGTKVNVA